MADALPWSDTVSVLAPICAHRQALMVIRRVFIGISLEAFALIRSCAFSIDALLVANWNTRSVDLLVTLLARCGSRRSDLHHTSTKFVLHVALVAAALIRSRASPVQAPFVTHRFTSSFFACGSQFVTLPAKADIRFQAVSGTSTTVVTLR